MSFRISEKTTEKAKRSIEAALQQMLPMGNAQLSFDDIGRATCDLLASLRVSVDVYEDRLGKRTLRYYRRKQIISPPVGQTTNARYGKQHVVEAAVARLSGHLNQLTLDQAAHRIASMDYDALLTFLAELVCQEWTHQAARPRALPRAEPAETVADALVPSPLTSPVLPASSVSVRSSIVLELPGGAALSLPAAHPVLQSADSLERLRHALAESLR